MRSAETFPSDERETSRLPREVIRCVHGVFPRGVRGRLALATSATSPSAFSYCVGTPKGLGHSPEGIDFAAEYPARTFPCRRFAAALAGSDA
jgi:hypothetical protein